MYICAGRGRMEVKMFDYDVDKMIHDEVFIQSIDRRERIIKYLYMTLGIPELQIRDDENIINLLQQLIREESPLLAGMEEDCEIYISEYGDDRFYVEQGEEDPRSKNAFYDRQKAKQYIEKYWKNYNPAYPSFGGYGGDCANFISQILHAGGMPWTDDGIPAHYSWSSNWYCKPGATAKDGDKRITLSWKVTAAFKSYWLQHAAKSVVMSYHDAAQNIDELSEQVRVADVIQFCYANGAPWHTLAVTGFFDDSENEIRDIVLVSHTIDSNTRSLYRTLLKNPPDYKLRIYFIKDGE